MKNLILTGFMGVGKSIVGRMLSDQFGLRFVDLDERVVARTGKSIADTFEQDGERAFRENESQLLSEVLERQGQVIATGGGALLSERNVSLLDSDQSVVCLTCSPEKLDQRLSNGPERPLLRGQDTEGLVSLLAQRAKAYQRFPQIDTSALSAEQTAREIGVKHDLALVGVLQVPPRKSSIFFESGAVQRVAELLPFKDVPTRALILSDPNVASTGLLEHVSDSLQKLGSSVSCVVIPAGEDHKNLRTLEQLYRTSQQAGLDRHAVIVAVGGGVVGDLAGLLAATYLRGVRLLLVPTTLVAQVDASLGGKVGVDFAGTKNLVGAFYAADAVVIDPSTLASLPAGLVTDGLAEIIKTAAVLSADLFADLEQMGHGPDVLANSWVVREAAQLKMQVVRKDPFDWHDRQLLNFGHTLGHALEAASGYSHSHGQAVSIGMAAELMVACRLNYSPQEVYDRVTGLLKRFRLSLHAPGIDPERVLQYVTQDKKRRQEVIRMAIPTAIGKGAVYDLTEEQVREAIDWAIGGSG